MRSIGRARSWVTRSRRTGGPLQCLLPEKVASHLISWAIVAQAARTCCESTDKIAGANEMGIETIVIVVVIVLVVLFVLGRVRA
jgi:hypothetical protein